VLWFSVIKIEFVFNPLISFLLREFSPFLEFSFIWVVPFLLGNIEVYRYRPIVVLRVLLRFARIGFI